jgi:hypothetical protein
MAWLVSSVVNERIALSCGWALFVIHFSDLPAFYVYKLWGPAGAGNFSHYSFQSNLLERYTFSNSFEPIFKMKVVIIGATGETGQSITKGLLEYRTQFVRSWCVHSNIILTNL